MSARILSIGTATPPGILSQDQSRALARTFAPSSVPDAVLERIHRACAIDQRHVCIVDPARGTQTFFTPGAGARGPTTAQRLAIYAELAGPLAIQAASVALRKSEVDPKHITHLITVSCTGFSAPGVDQALVWGLGLDMSVSRTIIGFMGCHAAINALRVANDIVRADPSAIVLLCCVELCSLHMHFSDRRDQLIANALFADGAAAAVLSHSAASSPRIRATASRLIPHTADLMAWSIGDHGFEMTLGAEVPDVLAREVAPWIDAVLASTGLTRTQIGAWAVHPGGPKVIDTVTFALSLDESHVQESRGVLKQLGNMSSPTILFILDTFMRTGQPLPWVAMAFGPGLAAEVVVLE